MKSRMLKYLAVASCITAAVTVSLFTRVDSLAAPPSELKPFFHWRFEESAVSKKQVKPIVGTMPARLIGDAVVRGDRVEFADPSDGVLIHPGMTPKSDFLPKRNFTIASWVRVDARQEWGAILGCFQDNGPQEKGVMLGFNKSTFVFGLATQGADDGDGRITYLAGQVKYDPGKWYHVAATYDGQSMRLYVNGVLDTSSNQQSGDVLYANKAPLMIGRYKDDDEDFGMVGAIRDVQWSATAATANLIRDQFQRQVAWSQEPASPQVLSDGFVIQPYLQYPSRTSMTIMFETAEPTTCRITYGFQAAGNLVAEEKELKSIHEIKLETLQPKSRYLYQVTCQTKDGSLVRSRVLSFGTAVDADDAWSFTVIGDTQKNPAVTGQVTKLMWERRPHFILHCGDVVDNGPDKAEWTDELFKPCQDVFGRVAVVPCIGNHEKNHDHYYRYFSLPKPEYYYSFLYGNAEFFSIDSNKPLIPGSEQYTWLDRSLAKSNAKWKFVFHHHPAYSSDSDDFGDSFKQFPTGDGSPNVKFLVPLYEKHKVDVVFNGHVHVYERTWPIRQNQVDQKNGVVYITTGGGGGSLEDFTPTPNFYKAEHKSEYHYCYVSIHQGTFHFKAIDKEGRLFDQFEIRKSTD